MINLYLGNGVKLDNVLIPGDYILVNTPKLAEVFLISDEDEIIDKYKPTIVMSEFSSEAKYANANVYFAPTTSDQVGILTWIRGRGINRVL